ncbi:hypothetical protein CEXT_725821 [Caerostris extrusa]|uniref:Uncharacterized protein n=1 Tax=Caerostris extrusa TaxID=172846 RepID=A0AAV4XUH6_CAEEX|nr:hypothetical protein CEXT_725821 [Caerostris extrusa]
MHMRRLVDFSDVQCISLNAISLEVLTCARVCLGIRQDDFFLPNILITRTFRENGSVTVKSMFAEQFVDGMSLELKYRATASHRELMIQSSGNEN